MKKIKLFFIAVLLFLMSFSITLIDTSAKGYVPDGYFEAAGDERDGMRHNGIAFCHISPHYNIDMDNLRERYRNVLAPYGIRGTLEYISALDVTFDDHEIETYLLLQVIIEDSIVKELHYYIGKDEYYYLPVSDSATGDYYEFTGFDFNDYYGENVRCVVIRNEADASQLEVYGSGNKRSFEAILPLLYSDMIFIDYERDYTNDYVIIDYNNPISREDIVKKLGIYGKKIGRIDNYEIIGYTYDPENVGPGKYTIKVRAVGSYDELYIKDIRVIANDYNPIEMDNIFVKYYDPIDEYYVLENVNISCEYNERILKSDYFDNSAKVGGYDYSVTIFTDDKGYYKKTSRIVVMDDLAPEIEGPDYLETNTENRLTEDDIKKEFTAIDDYSNEGSYIRVEDIGDEGEHYQNNYNKPGIYQVRIHAYDQFNNHSSIDIPIYVSQGPNYNPPVTSSESNSESINSSHSSTTSSTTGTTVVPEASSSQETLPTTSTNYWDQFVSSSTSNVAPSTSIPTSTSISSSVLRTSSTPSITSSRTSTSTPTTSPSTTTPSTSASSSTGRTSSTSTSNPPSSTTTSTNVTPSTSKDAFDWDYVLSIKKSYDDMMSSYSQSTSTPSSTTVSNPTTSQTTLPSASSLTSPSTSSSTSTSTTTSIPATSRSTSTNIPKTTTTTRVEEPSSIPSTSTESLDIIPSKSKINIPTTVERTDTSTTIIEASIQTTTETPVASTTNKASAIDSSTISTSKNTTKREEFKLVTSVNNRLTIDSIKDSLLDSDIITIDEYDLVTIDSAYFDTPDVGGDYLVTIKYPNGAKISYKLEVVDNNKKTTEAKDNTLLYVVIGAGAVILILIIVIIYILRKNKNEKKA